MTNLPDLITDERHNLELATDPGAYMEAMLGRAIMWLGEVKAIEEVVHQKCQSEALATFIREKELGRDAELSAAEIIRRCQRRIGQLIRQGQESGEIATQYDFGQPGVNPRELSRKATKVSPSTFFRGAEERRDTYALADGVPDETFEEAITEAKAEGKLSRANVVRKVKGSPDPKSERSEYNYKKRRVDPNRIVSQTVMMLDGLASNVDLVDVDALDPATIAEWIGPMKKHLATLNRFYKEMTLAYHAGS